MQLANYNFAPDISATISVFQMENAHENNTARPTEVPLGCIVTAQEHFQPKLKTITQPHNTTLVKLKDVIRDGRRKNIPALVVYGSEEQPIIVDGHHRLLAYRDQLSEDAEVSVEWFDGTYIEATAACLSLNDESKRCVYNSEKLTHIWRATVRLAKDGALWDADGSWLPEHSQKRMQQRYAPTSKTTIKNMRRKLTQLRDEFPLMTSGVAQKYRGDFYAFIVDDPVKLAYATWPKDVDARIDMIRGGSKGSSRSLSRSCFDFDDRAQQIAAAMTRGCGKEFFANQNNAELIADAIYQLNSENKVQTIVDNLLEHCSDEYLDELREALSE